MSQNLHPASYALAEQILDLTPVGTGIVATDTYELIAANDQFLSILETYIEPCWHSGKVIGHPLSDYLPTSLAIPLSQAFQTIIQTRQRLEFYNYSTTISAQQTIHWNCTITPILNDKDQVSTILITSSQITRQITTQTQLIEHHAIASHQYDIQVNLRKQQQIIETVTRHAQSSLDIETVGKNIIQALNLHFSPLSIYLHKALPEKKALQLLAAHADLPHNYEVQLSYVAYDSIYSFTKVYATYQPLIYENLQDAAEQGVLSQSLPIIAAGGQGYICLPLWFNDHFEGTLTLIFAHALQAEGMEVHALTQCATSIAAAFANARLYTAIQQEQNRLRTVLDQLPEGILLLDADGYISYINAAGIEISGLSAEAQLHIHTTDPLYAHKTFNMDNQLISADHFPAMRALQGEIVHHQEGKLLRPDGSTCILSTNAVPLRSEQGAITGAIAVFSDITQQKSAEQVRDEFFSIASHELRTPITTIQGFAEILQMLTQQGTLPSTPRTIRALQGIITHSQQLTRLIEDMLDLSRIESDLLFVHLEPHNIIPLISRIVEAQSLTAQRHTLTATFDGISPQDSVIAMIDEGRFTQILNNLISNAIKYSSAGTKITIGLRYSQEEPHHYQLWIKDEGVGIDAKELSHIFTRFHRASNFDHSISGLGIGLYLVKELVQRHRGKIWVESQLGMGATFYIDLPIAYSS